jgi:hypothetical protein
MDNIYTNLEYIMFKCPFIKDYVINNNYIVFDNKYAIKLIWLSGKRVVNDIISEVGELESKKYLQR